MNKKLLIALGGVVLLGVLILFAVQLNAPTRLSSADAETFARANQLNEKGQYATAVNLYELLLAKGIENADLYYNTGIAYAALKQPDKASEAFKHARALAPRDAQISQAAPAAQFNVPVTQNEIAIFVLGAAGCAALLFVFARHRVSLDAQS